jgi:hypothetical protein
VNASPSSFEQNTVHGLSIIRRESLQEGFQTNNYVNVRSQPGYIHSPKFIKSKQKDVHTEAAVGSPLLAPPKQDNILYSVLILSVLSAAHR